MSSNSSPSSSSSSSAAPRSSLPAGAATIREPYALGELPMARRLVTIDEQVVRAPLARIFTLAWEVEHWPAHLPHYRFVRFREKRADGGGLVEMSANRPFGVFDWPTWWLSEMAVHHDTPAVRFRHVGGVTTRMDVEWQFTERADGVLVRIVHTWDGPRWPLIGPFAATAVIGPVFVHGIASRTLAGLAAVAERESRNVNVAPYDATRLASASRDITRTSGSA